MDHSESYQKLIDSPIFQDWKKQHLDHYLTHFYRSLDNKFNLTGNWEIGFYHKKQDKITTFIINQKITFKPEEEVFKKQGQVEKLNLEEIKTTLPQALETFQKTKQKHYPKEILLNGFLILQKYQNQNIWNISYATKSLNILNLKINAANNNLISHQLINFIESKAS